MVSTESERLAPALVQKLEGIGYVLREPIGKSRLSKLVAAAGSLPEGVTRYLATSDGLKHSKLFDICGSNEMLKPYPSSSLLPLKGDGCGNLYGLVKEHWRDFVQHAREAYEAPLPKYVVDEFQKFLACGDFAAGFVHVQCTTCGDDMAVAFSCKLRGLCPSCAGRRMAGSAAHLVDRVLPTTPVRESSPS